MKPTREQQPQGQPAADGAADAPCNHRGEREHTRRQPHSLRNTSQQAAVKKHRHHGATAGTRSRKRS
jgi:hypothetical protein